MQLSARRQTCVSPEFHGDARVGDSEYNNRTDIGNDKEDPFVPTK